MRIARPVSAWASCGSSRRTVDSRRSASVKAGSGSTLLRLRFQPLSSTIASASTDIAPSIHPGQPACTSMSATTVAISRTLHRAIVPPQRNCPATAQLSRHSAIVRPLRNCPATAQLSRHHAIVPPPCNCPARSTASQIVPQVHRSHAQFLWISLCKGCTLAVQGLEFLGQIAAATKIDKKK